MNPETIYQQCREAVQILLAALEAGDIALVEHQVRAVRAYLGQRATTGPTAAAQASPCSAWSSSTPSKPSTIRSSAAC